MEMLIPILERSFISERMLTRIESRFVAFTVLSSFIKFFSLNWPDSRKTKKRSRLTYLGIVGRSILEKLHWDIFAFRLSHTKPLRFGIMTSSPTGGENILKEFLL